LREGGKGKCSQVPFFGRLQAAQGNGGVFRTGGYERHRRQWVKALKIFKTTKANVRYFLEIKIIPFDSLKALFFCKQYHCLDRDFNE